MARQARIEYPGALYHVICRGIERRELFRDDADRERYLSLVARAVDRFGFRVYAWCLMGNHLHMALETGRISLSRIMRSINTAYAGYFNVRHHRVGYLFQGRYKSFIVDKETYFLSLIRYILWNPVKARLTESVDSYRWSSYRSYFSDAPKWLAAGEVLGRFGRGRIIARRNFKAFVAGADEELSYEKAPRYLQAVVGEETFAREVVGEREGKEVLLRKPTASSLVTRIAGQEGVSIEDLRGPRRNRDLSQVRAICGFAAREVARVPMASIARYLRRDPTTLLRNVAFLENAMRTDSHLKRRVRELMKGLR